MSVRGKRTGQLIGGIGGAILIAALFMPWADAAETSKSAWDLMPGPAVVCVIAGLAGIGGLVTRGRVGFFRPDVSFSGAADLLSVAASLMIAWLLVFDLPTGSSAGAGIFVALGAAIVMACAVGDYGPFRGAPLFPPLRNETGDSSRDVKRSP